MKYKISKTLILIIIVICIIIQIKTVRCEEVNLQEQIILLKQYFQDELLNLIKQEDFKNEFGRSQINPKIMTRFYIEVMSKNEFIYQFLNSINWENYLTKNVDKDSIEIKIEVLEMFYQYIMDKQKIYNQIFIQKAIFVNFDQFAEIARLTIEKNQFFNLHPEANTDSYIITPAANDTYYIFQENFRKNINYILLAKSFVSIKIEGNNKNIEISLICHLIYRYYKKTFIYKSV